MTPRFPEIAGLKVRHRHTDNTIHSHEGGYEAHEHPADDDDICLCDAYRPDKRPGKCPIHATKKEQP